MSDNIVERLDAEALACMEPLFAEAAAEISRLQGEVARLHGILAFIDTATRLQAEGQMRQAGTGEER